MKQIADRQTRFLIVFIFLPALAMFSIPAAIWFLGDSSRTVRNREVDPRADFERHTGLSWPEGAKFVCAHDSHVDQDSVGFGIGPGIMDGELFIAFETDPTVLQEWLDAPAPWNMTWQSGPIPAEALRWTSLPDEFAANDVTFALHDACCPDTGSPFNDASLLVVDPQHGRVWFSSWNH
jgi:hypothetical protein